MPGQAYTIVDDTGLLALVDPDSYGAYFASSWTLDDLDAHFRDEMAARHLLIWETGREGDWLIQVHLAPVMVTGYRELTGPISVTSGRLLLTTFEGLSMAAQYADVTLPEPQDLEQVIAIPPGDYRCRLVQVAPTGLDIPPQESQDRPDFVVELLPTAEDVPVWREFGWANHFKRS